MGWMVQGSDSNGHEVFHTCPDQPWGQLVSYTMVSGAFLAVKQPGCGADHPPPSSAEVRERVELYLYSPSGTSWPVLG